MAPADPKGGVKIAAPVYTPRRTRLVRANGCGKFSGCGAEAMASYSPPAVMAMSSASCDSHEPAGARRYASDGEDSRFGAIPKPTVTEQR